MLVCFILTFNENKLSIEHQSKRLGKYLQQLNNCIYSNFLSVGIWHAVSYFKWIDSLFKNYFVKMQASKFCMHWISKAQMLIALRELTDKSTSKAMRNKFYLQILLLFLSIQSCQTIQCIASQEIAFSFFQKNAQLYKSYVT